MKTLICALSLLASITANSACDYYGNVFFLTIQPGQTQVVNYDYSDCWFGIQAWQVYVKKPTDKPLPNGAQLTADAIDLTSGEIAYHVLNNPFVLSFTEYSVCGHQLQLVLTNNGNKSIDVRVSTSENLAGPCQ